MFHGIPGGCQTPTPSQENSSSKGQESVASKDGLKEENCLQKCRQNYLDSMLQPPSKEGKQCSASSSVGDFLSLRGRCLSPHKKVSKIKILHSDSCRSRCLYSHDPGRGHFTALSFSYRKSPKKSYSQNKGTDGGMAWMSLDGLLVNVDDTISTDVVKLSGHQETVVWNGFSPLQKVLLVAVTAAAASAAKQRHTKEMKRLQLVIAKRDKDSQILREKISQLQEHLSFWKEQAQNFCGETMDIGAPGILILNENASPLFKLGLESTPKCDSVILEQFATPQLGQGVGEHNASFRRNLRAASFKNSRYRGGCLSKERWSMSSVGDNNKKRTFLDRLSESPSFAEGQSEASTPQLPLTQLNKIFTPHLSTDYVSPKQNGRLSRYCRKGCRRVSVTENSLTSHVPYEALILRLKNIMRQLLNNEAPDAIGAFASIKEKVQVLDSEVSRQSNILLPSCPAVRDLKESIDLASAKAILLQEAFVSIWDVLVEDPQSNVCFSRKGACLDMALTNNKEQILENQEMKDEIFCRQSDAENNRLAKGSDWFLTTTLDLDCTRNQEGDATNVDSVIQFAVKNTVDNLLAPLSERQKFDNSNWSSEMVIEQLLGELESAAAKVASMEAQIKTLRNSQILSQIKEEETERNLAEAIRRRRLQSEDSTCQDFTQTEQAGSHTCKELETTLELLKDAEKRFAVCREACKEKEKAISRLEDKLAVLQGMVSELQSLQATPNVVGQQDQASVQTFVTSNLLFNLDSPVKIDSPQSSFSSWKGLGELSRLSDSLERVSPQNSFSSWKGLHELSRLSDSLERESMNGSCDGEMYGLESVRAPQTDGYKDEPGCITSVLQLERNNNKHATRRGSAEESRRNRSNGEEASRNSSSTDELIRKSSSSSSRSSSSSSMDESGSGSVHHGRLSQVPKSYSNHARKPNFSNAADLRFPEDTSRRMPSSAEAAGGRRDDGTLGRKAGNVLSGVEPNTPFRDRKLSSAGKDKTFSHSVDSLNKAKENFAHRRRWM